MNKRVPDILYDVKKVPSPCFVVDESLLQKNLAILDSIQNRTGAKILLALKGFAMWSLFPMISKFKGSGVLHGACASSPDEARLAFEEFGGQVHVFAAAYSEADMQLILKYADHIIFNSFAQWQKYKPVIENYSRTIKCGIRVNPEYSEAKVAMYDPCHTSSRLGVRLPQFQGQDLSGISGLHFHTLCEQGSDALQRTLVHFEDKFGKYLQQMQWLNMGGGHHITRADYDIDLLCHCIKHMADKYNVEIYLEPGEAVVLNTGYLVTTVLDIIDADMPIAIMDTSAAAHMPDVLEMPYRPEIQGASHAGDKAHTYRLAGKSCLAGDVIGSYSFDEPLYIGKRCIFLDMAHYSMVKTTTFNGLRLPAIASYNKNDDILKIYRSFDYADFKTRLS